MNIFNERLYALRAKMKEQGVDYYLIPTADFHNSEYVNPYFKVREFMCGFSGSNGSLVISMDEALLWTDGRYFIQALKQLDGSEYEMMKMAEPGVPTIAEYLGTKLKNGQTLAFDGRCVNQAVLEDIKEHFITPSITIKMDEDMIDSLWSDRPAMPSTPLFYIPKELAGKTITEKLTEVKESLGEHDGVLLSKLDDIMWLYNIRANDVSCNPVSLAYSYITKDYATLFIQKNTDKAAALEALQDAGVILKDYEDFFMYLSEMNGGEDVLCAKAFTSALVVNTLEKDCKVSFGTNPTEILKACKNPVELENIRKFYVQDSAALTEFIYWIKHNAGKIDLNEYTAAMHLDGMRAALDGFIELSFPTISGYRENAAMMHYSATEISNKKIEAEGFLLVDSGGQYMGATTDVTRTISLGALTAEEKKHYTLVALGMLELMHAVWLHGCSGRNLDILARMRLWKQGIDYKCGTGHGIGYILNVHEGPQNIRWKYTETMVEAVLEEGMIVSNEPGVYIENSHGIRIENIHAIQKDVCTSDGQFMSFDNLTFAPLDRAAFDLSIMSLEDIARVNAYQKSVYETVSPYLSEDAAKWLFEECKPLD
ncbi:MAG: aminopeptidase P family protein [Lachnospiraceae bacterium]